MSVTTSGHVKLKETPSDSRQRSAAIARQHENPGARVLCSSTNPAYTDENRPVNGVIMQRLFNMSEKRISLGINVSILVILIIFGVLLSLPLRLMMNTNYYTQNQTGENENLAMEAMGNATSEEATVIPLDHRKLKRCPRLQYQDRLKSVFRSDYDGNCTYRGVYASDNVEDDDEEDRNEKGGEDAGDRSKATKESVGDNLTESTEESGKDRRMKSVPVAGHILVTMLLISAIAALVEVLRIRFARDKVLQRRPH